MPPLDGALLPTQSFFTMNTPTQPPPPAALQLSAADNVAVARQALEAGTTLQVGAHTLVLRDAIASGHKVALLPIAQGAPVLKYGQNIGVATADIPAGAHVHVHNVGMAESQHAHTAGAGYKPTAVAPQPLTFDGYVRPDGRVATRNYLGVIASVNCSATVCRHICRICPIFKNSCKISLGSRICCVRCSS